MFFMSNCCNIYSQSQTKSIYLLALFRTRAGDTEGGQDLPTQYSDDTDGLTGSKGEEVVEVVEL